MGCSVARWLSIACWMALAGLGSPVVADEPADSPAIESNAPAQSMDGRSGTSAQHPSKTNVQRRPWSEARTSRSARIPARAFVHTLPDPAVTNQTRQALDFYGGYAARATLSRLPRRTPVVTGSAQPMYRQIKPFQTVYRDPTVSPYLNLYRDENDSEGAPNYFAFVRPQMEQIEANRMQYREIHKLRGHMQGTPPAMAVPSPQPSGVRGSTTSARYMDTAQFYGGWRR